MEHDEQAERLEREAEQLEHQSEQVGEEIEQTRREWEAKQEDSSVPGAAPRGDEESLPGVETDPKRVREEGGP